MDQDNKNTTGAPSNDTTSALFVSARKKQLEQQEAERRAKEKEEQRLAAEAEVRRLEREVEERRRKAEEDAKRADEDTRRIAEESRARQAQAAANPDAVLGAPPSKPQGVKLPGVKLPGAAPSTASPAAPKPTAMPKAAAVSSGDGAAAVKTPPNMKMIAIIGGAVVVAIIVVVLIITLGGGSRKSDVIAADSPSISAGAEDGPGAIITLEDMGGAPAGMKRFSDNDMGIAFNYSGKWAAELYRAGGSNLSYDCAMVAPADGSDTIIVIANFSEKYNSYISNGGTDGNALVESLISDAGLLAGFKVSDLKDLEYLDMRENPDGSIEFDAVWNNGGGYASVAVFEDRGVASAAVVLTSSSDQTDYINAVFTSIEVW